MSELLNKVTDAKIQGSAGMLINYQGSKFEGDFRFGPGIYLYNGKNWIPNDKVSENILKSQIWNNDYTASAKLNKITANENFFISSSPLIVFNDGTLGIISWVQAVLPGGIYITECYELGNNNLISGRWVAFKESSTGDREFQKIAELPMTEQFWEYWFDWAVTGGEYADNELAFVTMGRNVNSANLIDVRTTYIKVDFDQRSGIWTMVAKDSKITPEKTWMQLYNDVAGTKIDASVELIYDTPLWDAQHNFSGMANGPHRGYVYIAPFAGYSDTAFANFVGFNILTGKTILVDVKDKADALVNFELVGIHDRRIFINDYSNDFTQGSLFYTTNSTVVPPFQIGEIVDYSTTDGMGVVTIVATGTVAELDTVEGQLRVKFTNISGSFAIDQNIVGRTNLGTARVATDFVPVKLLTNLYVDNDLTRYIPSGPAKIVEGDKFVDVIVGVTSFDAFTNKTVIALSPGIEHTLAAEARFRVDMTAYKPTNFGIVNLLAHPNGLLFTKRDGNIFDSTDLNLKGVTAFWSPMWRNNKHVARFDVRNPSTKQLEALDGNMARTFGSYDFTNDFLVSIISYRPEAVFGSPGVFMGYRLMLDAGKQFSQLSYLHTKSNTTNNFESIQSLYPYNVGGGVIGVNSFGKYEGNSFSNFFPFWADSQNHMVGLNAEIVYPYSFINRTMFDYGSFVYNYLSFAVLEQTFDVKI